MLKLLASQAAISLENTRLYRDSRNGKRRSGGWLTPTSSASHLEAEGRILEANDAFLRMVGYDRDDLAIGSRALDRSDAAGMAPRSRRALAELPTTGTPQPFEKEYFRKDGSRVPVLVGAATSTKREEGVAFVLDLTERKRAEAEAAESERRYREVQTELAHANRVTDDGAAHCLDRP